jgi:hypothetical protein
MATLAVRQFSCRLATRQSSWTRGAYLDLITEGGYPEVLTIGVPAVRRSWYEGYLSTVIVRDIGDFASLRDAEVIPKVLSLVAARAGSPMVHADVARDLAVRPDTVRNYLAYLDIVFLTATADARHLRWLKGKLGDRMTAGVVLHLGSAAGRGPAPGCRFLLHVKTRSHEALQSHPSLFVTRPATL